MENKLLYFGLTASLCLHATVIGFFSFVPSGSRIFEKPLKEIEVTYRAVNREKTRTPQPLFKDVKVIRPKPAPEKIKVLSKEYDTFSTFQEPVKDISKMPKGIMPDQKAVAKITALDLDRKVTVPLLKAEKITNPKYLSYNESIRARIRQRAYAYVSSPEFAAGEVYLTFILESTGELKAIKIIPSKTFANDYVRNAGMRSVQESAPFAPFPEDLNYPELTFNVIISFKVGD